MKTFDYFYETKASKLTTKEMKADETFEYVKSLSKIFTMYVLTDIKLIDMRDFSGEMILWYETDKYSKLVDRELNSHEER